MYLRSRRNARSQIVEQISISSDDAESNEGSVQIVSSISNSEDELMETSDVDEDSSGESSVDDETATSAVQGTAETVGQYSNETTEAREHVVQELTLTTVQTTDENIPEEQNRLTSEESKSPHPNKSKSQQTTPGLEKNGPKQQNQMKNESSDDEEQSCPICFEPWTNSGKHRLSSLSCGHLFGRSCIERWLKDPKNKCCPQCKEKALRKDIRNIYAKSLKAMDTTDRDQARKELAEEKYKRSKAEENEAKALLRCQLLQSELEKLKRQYKEIPTSMENRQPVAAGPSCAFSSSQSSQSSNQFVSASQLQTNISSTPLERISKSYVFQKSVVVSNKEARVIAYDSQRMLLAISKPSPNQLFTGYGVLKLSPLDSRSSEYIRIHQKHIRDSKFNQTGDELLLTGSLDKTMKLTSMVSNSIVQRFVSIVDNQMFYIAAHFEKRPHEKGYSFQAPVWACAWDSKDINFVYAGLQNGTCCIYDIRKTNDPVFSIKPRIGVPCPIVSLSPVKASMNSEGCDGIIVGTIQGGWFIKNVNNTEFTDHQLLFPSGSSCGISYESNTCHCLLSQRPGKQLSRMTHSIYSLDGDASLDSPIRVSSIRKCHGGNRSQNLTRSSLFTCPDDESRLMVCSGDESSASVIVWDGSNGREHQKIPSYGGVVFDVLTFNAYNSNYLAALTEQKLSFYKWQ